MGRMIVPEQSAMLGYPKEMRHGLNGDHIGIAKYSFKNDPNYLCIFTELHELVIKIRKETQESKIAAETP